MLKMVTVNRSETLRLISLLNKLPVTAGGDSPPVDYIVSTLTKMLDVFKSETDTTKITLPNEFYTLLRMAVEPDADLLRKFDEPELVDPNFVGFTQTPDTRFLN